jgi:hypothetical protein
MCSSPFKFLLYLSIEYNLRLDHIQLLTFYKNLIEVLIILREIPG